MGENSGIDWTDHTWNPWQGCHKVSAGCDNCYMYTDKNRYGQDPTTVIRSMPATFNKPNSWKEPAMVFTCSWSDFFIHDADPWRDEAWEVIRNNPHLIFQILTKRPENVLNRLPADWPFWNVWLGVTAENQEMADRRIPILASIPAALKFISVEPMITPVILPIKHLVDIDWVICGGESGPKARRMEPEWAYMLMHQCFVHDIPFFMKQMAGTTKGERERIPHILDIRMFPEGYER